MAAGGGNTVLGITEAQYISPLGSLGRVICYVAWILIHVHILGSLGRVICGKDFDTCTYSTVYCVHHILYIKETVQSMQLSLRDIVVLNQLCKLHKYIYGFK